MVQHANSTFSWVCADRAVPKQSPLHPSISLPGLVPINQYLRIPIFKREYPVLKRHESSRLAVVIAELLWFSDPHPHVAEPRKWQSSPLTALYIEQRRVRTFQSGNVFKSPCFYIISKFRHFSNQESLNIPNFDSICHFNFNIFHRYLFDIKIVYKSAG